MSHFTVTVALDPDLPNTKEALQEALEAALEPYDETIVVERYVQHTKAELIARERQRIEDYHTIRYAEYLADPEKYARECSSPAHLEYISKEFPAKLTWTDEQVYQDARRAYPSEDIGPDGEVYSTYNPRSHWDWWTIGGRWGGFLTLKGDAEDGALSTEESAFGMAPEAEVERHTDCARIKDIGPESIKPPFAYIDLDGEWYQKGEMGWFGMSSDEKEQVDWNREYGNWLLKLPKNCWLVNIDCHV